MSIIYRRWDTQRFPNPNQTSLPLRFFQLCCNIVYTTFLTPWHQFLSPTCSYIKMVILYETLHVPVADDFIDVHVALCTGASLPDDQRKVIVQLTIMNLGRKRRHNLIKHKCIMTKFYEVNSQVQRPLPYKVSVVQCRQSLRWVT